MKKKLILCSLILAMILAGCNKDGEVPPQDTEQPMATPMPQFTMTDIVEYEAGTELDTSSIVNIPEMDMLNVSQVAFLSNDGSVSDKLIIREGTNGVTVVVQFTDGNSWSAEYTYTGTKKLLDIPEQLRENVKIEQWLKSNLTTLDTTLQEPVSVPSDKIIWVTDDIDLLGTEEALGMGLGIKGTFDKDTWAVSLVDADDMSYLSQANMSPIANVPEGTIIANMFEWFLNTMIEEKESTLNENPTESTETQAEDVVGESVESEETDTTDVNINVSENEEVTSEVDLEYTKKFVEYFLKFMKNCYSAEILETEYFIYDEEGTAYPVKAVQASVDTTLVGGTKESWIQRYYVELETGELLIFNQIGDSMYDYSKDIVVNTIPDDTVAEAESELPKLDTYEDFIIWLSENPQADMESSMNISPYYKSSECKEMVARFMNKVVIGDYEVLKAVIEAEESSNNVVEVDPNATPTPTPLPTPTPVLTYKDKNPSLYRWPTDEIKYSRWIYIIDEDVNYKGSIIFPDGKNHLDEILNLYLKTYVPMPTPTLQPGIDVGPIPTCTPTPVASTEQEYPTCNTYTHTIRFNS